MPLILFHVAVSSQFFPELGRQPVQTFLPVIYLVAWNFANEKYNSNCKY